jgi:D,D-heptose 1,7-bisphosphate phosphatase
MTRNKAVFLDRDGTLNEEVDYLSHIEDLKIFKETKLALRKFKNFGFLNIVVTNQSGISRGFLTEKDLQEIHNEFSARLEDEGVCLIDEIYYSPYHVDGVIEKYKLDSPDRKPGIGLITKAVDKHNIDLKESFFIGDSFTDMQCAGNAGLRKILVATGYGSRDYQKCLDMNLKPDFFAKDILDASEYITRLEVGKEIKSYN